MGTNERHDGGPRGAEPAPVDLKLRMKAQELVVTWADGRRSVYPMAYLRAKCPCAQCRTHRGEQGPPAVVSAGPDEPVTVANAELAGNYAVRFVWSDGHDTGIYNYTYLRQIDPAAGPESEPPRPAR